MKTDKSILIEQLEWALVKAKYSPNANFNEIAEHLDYAQSLIKNLIISYTRTLKREQKNKKNENIQRF